MLVSRVGIGHIASLLLFNSCLLTLRGLYGWQSGSHLRRVGARGAAQRREPGVGRRGGGGGGGGAGAAVRAGRRQHAPLRVRAALHGAAEPGGHLPADELAPTHREGTLWSSIL